MERPGKDGHGDLDRDAAMAALAKSQLNLMETQQLAHIGSWEWDVGGDIVQWSDEQYRLFGRERDGSALTYETYLGHLSEADRKETSALVEAALRGKGDYAVDHEIIRSDGTIRYVTERGRVIFGPDGKPVRMFGTTQDTTDRREHEAALRDKQRDLEVQMAFLSAIVDNIPAAIFIKDIRDQFRVTLWNKGAEEIFQVRKEEIIGKTAHDLWPKEQADLYLAADRRVAEAGGPQWKQEEPSQTKDRGTILLNTVKMPLSIGNRPGAQYLLAISHDITEEKRAKAELESAKDAAEAANRAKSEFLATMSHEIRTPLNGVLGMAKLLMDTPLTGEQRDMVMIMRDSGSILLNVLNDILDYSKIEAGKLDIGILPFDMEEVILEIAGIMRSQADQKGLYLEVAFPSHVPRAVLGDPARIRQVLMNLVGNAVKFTDAGGIAIRAEAEGPHIIVRIIDTGIGIPGNMHHRIFRKFSQVDASTTRKHGGTGLGLIISKRLMEMMGGRLEFESQVGKGSTFSFTLPASGREPEGAGAASDLLHRESGEAPDREFAAGTRILLVEDNPVNQKVGKYMLENLGCRVDLAQNGAEAVSMAKNHAYSALLMDIQMPVMDGPDATRKIREWEAYRSRNFPGPGSDRRMPIIALSASVMHEDRENALRVGMDDFLTKPLLIHELRRVLSRALARD